MSYRFPSRRKTADRIRFIGFGLFILGAIAFLGCGVVTVLVEHQILSILWLQLLAVVTLFFATSSVFCLVASED
jgi:hypothetical protein